MKLIKIIKWHIYSYILNKKHERCASFGFSEKLRLIEHRKYLTKDGFKEWSQLSIADLISLNIVYPYDKYINS